METDEEDDEWREKVMSKFETFFFGYESFLIMC